MPHCQAKLATYAEVAAVRVRVEAHVRCRYTANVPLALAGLQPSLAGDRGHLRRHGSRLVACPHSGLPYLCLPVTSAHDAMHSTKGIGPCRVPSRLSFGVRVLRGCVIAVTRIYGASYTHKKFVLSGCIGPAHDLQIPRVPKFGLYSAGQFCPLLL